MPLQMPHQKGISISTSFLHGTSTQVSSPSYTTAWPRRQNKASCLQQVCDICSWPGPALRLPSRDSTLIPVLLAIRQSNFEQAVAYALHLWPALNLSVQNGWGGPDSSDKRDWFAGAIVDLFPAFSDGPVSAAPAASTSASNPAIKQEPDLQDVEEVLLQVMIDEFEINVDDDSGAEVAGQILKARAGCLIGNFDEVKALHQRFSNRKGMKVDVMYKKVEEDDQDTDWESDDSDDDDEEADDEDEEMDDAPALVQVPKQKTEPEVDDDGFTKVTKKKR